MRLPAHVRAGAVAGAASFAITAACAFAPGVAYAESPRDESRTAFLRGVNEAHQSHFTAARDAFIEAYRLFPHPSILMNLGIARMRTGEYLASERDLTRFLKDDGGALPEDLANANAALVVVRGHIGTLRVRVSPRTAHATLDGAPLALTASTFVDVRAVVGPGELKVTADGYTPVMREVMVSREQIEPVDVILTPSAPSATAGDGPEHASGGLRSERHALLGWGLIGTGGILAVVGTVAGIEAISLAHDYNTPGSGQYQASSTRSSGVAWRTSADVLFVTAFVAGGAGAYVLLRPIPKADTRVAVSPSFVGVVGRF
jgi:hypothetical protein